MEYCLDTGDLEMVKKVADLYPIRCFSMNPSIAVNCLRGTGRTFLQNAKMIREVIGEDTPFYLEAMGDTAEEMIEDAHKIRQEIKGNTMIKIPACPQGFKAIRLLKEEDILCSCTAIYDFNQAMLAAEAGAYCVAVYVSRVDNSGGDGIEVVRKIKEAFVMADNVTVTLDLLEKMAIHPLTQKTLDTFKADWESLFGEGMRVANMTE